MKSHYSKSIAYATFTLLLLSFSSISASAGWSLNYGKVDIEYQRGEFRKADGTSFTAEFAGELLLLEDGRANGGFGVWEDDVVSFYRVTEGNVTPENQGTLFKWQFHAQKIGETSGAQEIVITVPAKHGHVPEGSVRFVVDGLNALDGQPVEVRAHGSIHKGSVPNLDLLNEQFKFVYVNAPSQTVVVQTLQGIFTGTFEHSVLIFPSGDAIGFATLAQTSRNPLPNAIRLTNARVEPDRDGIEGNIILHGRTVGDPQPLPVLMVIKGGDFSEPCRIYDIAGTQVGTFAHFEAETLITRFRIGQP